MIQPRQHKLFPRFIFSIIFDFTGCIYHGSINKKVNLKPLETKADFHPSDFLVSFSPTFPATDSFPLLLFFFFRKTYLTKAEAGWPWGTGRMWYLQDNCFQPSHLSISTLEMYYPPLIICSSFSASTLCLATVDRRKRVRFPTQALKAPAPRSKRPSSCSWYSPCKF